MKIKNTLVALAAPFLMNAQAVHHCANRFKHRKK